MGNLKKWQKIPFLLGKSPTNQGFAKNKHCFKQSRSQLYEKMKKVARKTFRAKALLKQTIKNNHII